jgi:nitroimidazol reductase NimA-like FMN-containing flavoprotein (pyridoxamine 5'-phosphate oxidase superfamily)
MRIGELTARGYSETLAHASIGKRRCPRKDQPPITPSYVLRELGHLYGFGTKGQRMRRNSKVCIETHGTTSHLERTRMVRYFELPDERDHARRRLESRSLCWQDAFASRQTKTGDNFTPPLFHCIDIESMTGCPAIADGGPAATVTPAPDSSRTT